MDLIPAIALLDMSASTQNARSDNARSQFERSREHCEFALGIVAKILFFFRKDCSGKPAHLSFLGQMGTPQNLNLK